MTVLPNSISEMHPEAIIKMIEDLKGEVMNNREEAVNLRQYIVSQRIIIQDLKDYIEVLEKSIRMKEASVMFALPPPA